ncbi:MAG: sortase domain-containing protein [Bellilinea sp.]
MDNSDRISLGWLTAILAIVILLAGCGNLETGKALPLPSLSSLLSVTIQPTAQPTIQPTAEPTIEPTPTLFILGSSYDLNLDLRSGPVDVPLELQIPVLNVNAPVLGVGLTADNVMDAPKGPIGDPVWHTAFWYRGGGIPGESGTATIAGHVTDPLGNPEIFANLKNLSPGDAIIVHVKNSTLNIRFIVDQIKVYSIQESTDPTVLSKIYGPGIVEGTGPQPALDGLSHLTLITCAGRYVNGEFDHHTVVFATISTEEPSNSQP